MYYYNIGDNKCQGRTYAIQLPILSMCRHLAGSKKIIFIRMSWRRRMKQYFHVVLFIMLYKVVLTFKSIYETLVCDHSFEQYFYGGGVATRWC